MRSGGHPVVELFGKLREDGRGRRARPISAGAGVPFAARCPCAVCEGGGDLLQLPPQRVLSRKPGDHARGQAEIEDLCGWLCGIGVETVTVSSPFLLRIVKTRYPELKVRGLRVRRRGSRAQGADVGGDGRGRHRPRQPPREPGIFTLARIRESVKCDLELLVNNNCLSSCALSPAHMKPWPMPARNGMETAASSSTGASCGARDEAAGSGELHPLGVDPPGRRPAYEEMGYDLFKVTERDLPTAVMVNRSGPMRSAGTTAISSTWSSRTPCRMWMGANGTTGRDRGGCEGSSFAGAGQPGPDAPAEAAGGLAAHDPSGDGRASGGRRQPGARRLHRNGFGRKGAATWSARRAAGATISRKRRSGFDPEESRRALAAYDEVFRSSTAGRCGDTFRAGTGSATRNGRFRLKAREWLDVRKGNGRTTNVTSPRPRLRYDWRHE